MTQSLFSILIAQYNNGKYFKDCYQSIMAQTYGNWEAIIVDDCSSDDSVAQMKKLIGDDPRFKLYQNTENKGCGFTKRKLAELAAGEICGFVDPDDAITENAIEVMVEKHRELPDVGLVYSNFIFCDENLCRGKIQFQKKVEDFKIDFFNLESSISAFASYKKRIYKQTTGIDDYLFRAVDQDLYLKLYENAKVFYLDETFYLYRHHDGGISTNVNTEKAYFWKWVVIIDAAKRRKVNLENLFIAEASKSFRQQALETEINSYNRSVIFKILRKLGFLKI